MGKAEIVACCIHVKTLWATILIPRHWTAELDAPGSGPTRQ